VKYLSIHGTARIPVKQTLVALGFCNVSTTLAYFTSRGWGLEEAKLKLKACQGTMSVKNIQKTHNVSEQEAREIRKARTDKAFKTLSSRDDYATITKTHGDSMRAEFYYTKRNPETGTLYTEKEAKLKISNRASKRAHIFWDDVYANGKRVFEGNTQLEYYLVLGNTLAEAEALLSKRQATFSLEKCIATLGEEHGLSRWRERQLKWLASLDTLSDEDKERVLIAKTTWLKRYSKEATKFIQTLLTALEINQFDDDVWMCDRKRFIVQQPKIYFYDLYIGRYNLYLEYNGSNYHPNPLKLDTLEKWNKWVQPLTGINADIQAEKDRMKRALAISQGGIFMKYGIPIIIKKSYEKFVI
jgi:hypothetical protein